MNRKEGDEHKRTKQYTYVIQQLIYDFNYMHHNRKTHEQNEWTMTRKQLNSTIIITLNVELVLKSAADFILL